MFKVLLNNGLIFITDSFICDNSNFLYINDFKILFKSVKDVYLLKGNH